MKKTKEESLTNVNKQGLMYKIKKFFQKIINNKNNEKNINEIKVAETGKFKETIKNIKNDETELLELQKRFRNGQIKEGELSQEQIDKLCELYDMQIRNLKISIEMRKKRLEEYRRKNQTKKV